MLTLLKEIQYAKWKAACVLASKGKTMAYSSYRTEVNNIQSFLQMKSLAPPPGHAVPDVDAMEMNAECFVSPRYTKKYKAKQVKKALTLGHFHEMRFYHRALSGRLFIEFRGTTGKKPVLKDHIKQK